MQPTMKTSFMEFQHATGGRVSEEGTSGLPPAQQLLRVRSVWRRPREAVHKPLREKIALHIPCARWLSGI